VLTFQKFSKLKFFSSTETFGSSRLVSNSDFELSAALDSRKVWNPLGIIDANELLVSFVEEDD